jgi:hypothetical protein
MGLSVAIFGGFIIPAAVVLPMLIIFIFVISRAIMHPETLRDQNSHSVQIVFSPRPCANHNQEGKPHLYELWLDPKIRCAETQWHTMLVRYLTPVIDNWYSNNVYLAVFCYDFNSKSVNYHCARHRADFSQTSTFGISDSACLYEKLNKCDCTISNIHCQYSQRT